MGHTDDEPLEKRLQRLLKERALTARAAAKAIKCPQSTFAGWLHGATPTDFHGLKRLAELLGVSFSYLMTGEADAPLDPREVMVGGETLLDGIMEVKVRRVKVRRKDPGQ